ncbi:ABC transporter ATP-binding protein [Opitutales bacterium ASA1]|uniref:ABC transporter ATP-binding protein n=1 Tax=Congregicoccus parvus TaxID=3081749 RepID=UPI002B29D8BB|nr:ABC transporter ATP-binding protein [Opitutales bacterium ASA1]
MTDSETTIEVEHLYKRFGGVEAVNNISFEVRRGEIIGFLGPNGAGKSTTMRILTGYVPATSGIVRICGYSVAGEPTQVKRRIGYMPENNPLPEDLRVREYLAWRGRLKELGGKRLRERLETALEVCDLHRSQNRIIGKLSKGYRQRVGVADAILAEPDVIIMDEPTIGLDPHQILMIRDLIASLRGRMSVLISSHILPEIEMTCDRVIIINQGRIVASGTPSQLRNEFLLRATYELEIKGDIREAQQTLAAFTPKEQVEHALERPDRDGFYRINVQLRSDRHYGEDILSAVNTNPRLRIRALRRREASLEEVFLAATRRSWDTVTPLAGRDAARDATASVPSADAPRPAAAPAEPLPLSPDRPS